MPAKKIVSLAAAKPAANVVSLEAANTAARITGVIFQEYRGSISRRARYLKAIYQSILDGEDYFWTRLALTKRVLAKSKDTGCGFGKSIFMVRRINVYTAKCTHLHPI